MSGVRVILITVAGPGGHVDVGVRSDATPADLANALGGVIGVSPAATVIEHRSPPRPGVPEGARVLVQSGTALAEAGVADGDLVLFRTANGPAGYSWPEVQGRPAEFDARPPQPDRPALRAPRLDAPAVLSARRFDAPAIPSAPQPDQPDPPALSAPRGGAPAALSAPQPDALAQSAPDPEVPTQIAPDFRSPVGSPDLWSAAASAPAALPTGRHARGRPDPGGLQPEAAPGTADCPQPATEPAQEDWPEPATEPAEDNWPAPATEPRREDWPQPAAEPAQDNWPEPATEPAEDDWPAPATEPRREDWPQPATEPAQDNWPAPATEPAHEDWPALETEPAQEDQPGTHGSEEVSPGDWPG
jgi:hypothetical protein